LAALRAPFPLDYHIIREGHKMGSKQVWYAYIDRSNVQDLLEDVFPGEWETTEPKLYFNFYTITRNQGKEDETVETIPIVSATVGITIRGITRWDGGDSEGDESTKGALTNAFRRTAAYGWKIGRYLYDGVTIETSTWNKGDWKARNAAKEDAWKQFTTWYNQRYEIPQNTPPQASNNALASNQVSPTTKQQNGAPTGDINVFFTLGATHFKQVNWKERNNTIVKIFDEGGFAGKSEAECVQVMADRFASHDRNRPASEGEF
jgi:hypothetical protein